MAAWMIRSSHASVVSPGTMSRRQIGGSVPMSVTLTWYVQDGSSFLLAAVVRGMRAILTHLRMRRAVDRPDPIWGLEQGVGTEVPPRAQAARWRRRPAHRPQPPRH